MNLVSRTAALALLAACVFVLSTLGTAGIAGADPQVRCQPCTPCDPICGQPCPTGGLTIVANVQAQITNFSATFGPSGGSNQPTLAYFNLSWGPTSAYGYNPVVNEKVGTITPGTSLVNYLNPGATYYWQVQAWLPCHDNLGWHFYHASSSGQLTVGAESGYLSKYGNFMKGTVQDTTGSAAPSNVQIGITCLDTAYPYGEYAQYGNTGSNGVFSVLIGRADGQPECAGASPAGYVVSVENGILGASAQWNNHWNETIVIYSPQFVNFYLNTAHLSSTAIADSMEFTHTNNAQVAYCKDTSSTAETEADLSVSGTAFGVGFDYQSTTSYSYTFGSSSCDSGVGSPGFEDWGYHYVAGDVAFDAVDGRVSSIPWIQYYGPAYNGGTGNAGAGPVQDWATEPTSASGACTIQNNVWFHWEVPGNSGLETETVYAAGTVSGETGMSAGASLQLDLDGTSVATLSYTQGTTLTTSESSQFYASVLIPNDSSNQYFTISCSGSGQSDTGIVLHVWQDSGPG